MTILRPASILAICLLWQAGAVAQISLTPPGAAPPPAESKPKDKPKPKPPVAAKKPAPAATPKPAATPAPAATVVPAPAPDDPNVDLVFGAYQRGQYKTAFDLATRRAQDNGDPKAMTMLGELYANAMGVKRDYARAAEWYRRAAEGGDREGMFAYAMLRLSGRGGAVNREEAVKWLASSAKLGNPKAAYNLALLYLDGQTLPQDVKRAAELLRGTGVYVGAVIGFPHGNSTIESKRYETQLACRDGAVEIDMVINVGKALSGDWDYVEWDVKAVCDEAHRHAAKVKVIFENDYLAQGGAGLGSDDFKKKLCNLCERAGVDWVKTSTGYGFVKQPDGSYNYQGATEHDLGLMRASVSARVQVKVAGGVRDLDGLIKVRDLGATRCGATATAAMLGEYRRREAAEKVGVSSSHQSGSIGTGGY